MFLAAKCLKCHGGVKASLAAAVAAANTAGSSPYSAAAPPYTPQSAVPAYRPATGAGGPAPIPANHIAVINTRQSNLITIPILNEGKAIINK